MADEQSSTERALDLLVFGPIGLAAYLRDTAPSFLKIFVSRGRAIIDGQRKSVEDQLGQARSVGEFASAHGGPQVQRLMTDAIAMARARAEEALERLGGLTGVPEPGLAPVPTGPAATADAPAPVDESDHLAIRDYDELSASQVVERLEGLAAADLDAIRAYEVSHRARNTVVGKLDQLQQRSAG